MAVLTPADKQALFEVLQNDPAAWDEIKNLRPNRHTIFQALQGLENLIDAPTTRLQLKSAMETASGLTLSNSLAKKLAKAYFATKWRTE